LTSGTDASRSDYYADFWRSPKLQMTEYMRWKLEVTRSHPRVAAARSVLDVGCGPGVLLAGLRAPGKRLCGVEMSAEAVQAIETEGIEGRAVDLETERLPYADGEFDAVLCYDVLEHLFSPGRVLAEIRRVVRPGGVVLLCVPNTLNLFNRLIFLSGRFIDVMDASHQNGELFSNHIRLFSRALFDRFVTAGGLAIDERHNYFPARLSDSYFKLPPLLARLVTAPRLHELAPSAFALAFLYVCSTSGGGSGAQAAT
jgi:SAM-dependent methyltransferase